ncbi:MAG: conjugal transfer protein [Oscillospiraceae bacterium]|nr:conjugal transfer protein [Oscillospiraceae bacterium]
MWIYCPYCGRKTRSKMLKQSVMQYCPVYCPKCRREIIVHAKQLKIEVCDEVR